MKYLLTLHSPLHIGGGEENVKYQDQFWFEDKMYPLGIQTVTEFLAQYPGKMRAYSDWLDEKAKEMYGKGKMDTQAFSNLRSNIVIKEFLAQQGLLEAFEAFLEEHPNAEGIEVERDALDLKRQVSLQLKTGTGKPLIPGSSIKGAIRSALLFHFMRNHATEVKEAHLDRLDKLAQLGEEIQRDKRKRRRIAGKIDDWIEDQCFFCYSSTDRAHRSKNQRDDRDTGLPQERWKNEATFDLMKFIQVSDVELRTHTPITRIVPSARYSVKKGKSVQQDLSPHLEVILPGTSLEFRLEFKAAEFWDLMRRLMNPKGKLEQEMKRDLWQGISEKIKWVFGLQWNEIQQLAPADRDEILKEQVSKHLVKCLKEWSDLIAIRDRDWLERLEEYAPYEAYQLGKYSASMADNLDLGGANVPREALSEDIPIHLGFGKGFHASSMMFAFLFEDEETKEIYKEILDYYTENKMKPGYDNTSQLEYFPFSRVLVTTFEGLVPLGYASLAPKPS